MGPGSSSEHDGIGPQESDALAAVGSGAGGGSDARVGVPVVEVVAGSAVVAGEDVVVGTDAGLDDAAVGTPDDSSVGAEDP